jgi:hypothetical protein
MLEPISKIKADFGLEANGYIQKFFTNTCRIHIDKYVPMDTGTLRENVIMEADSITYDQPYAHAQYVGYTKGPVRHYTTPGTGPYWDKRMVSAEMQNIINECQAEINKRSK